MADTIEIVQGTATTIEIGGLQGPQGPQGATGSGLGTLTTQGDTLYQGASAAQRLPIGTAGQILKVNSGGTAPEWGAAPASGVSSVNGESGAVSLSAADVGAAAATHTHDGTDVFLTDDEAYGPVLVQSFAEGRNGIYWPTDLTINGKPVYKLNRIYGMFFENLRWHIFENSAITANIVSSSADDQEDFPHQTTWSGGNVQRANVANLGERAAQQFQFVGDVQRVGTSSGLPLKTGSGGEVQAGAFGTGAGQFAEGNHTHGNLTNDGKIGTTANLPLKTGTAGVIEAGSFSNTAGTFCEGNDARLSDARTPSSTLAHKASHATGGTDALAPSDIGAQSLFTSSSITSATTLSAGRARIFDVSNFGSAYNIILPLTNSQNGDIVVFRATNLIAASVSIIYEPSGSLPVTIGTITAVGQQYRFIYRAGPQDWVPVAVDTHTHAASDITSGTLDIARLPVGTGSTQVAAGNHTHVVADVTGAAASGSITTSGLTQATARILGRTTASTGSIEEIQIGSGLSLSAGELSATGSGVTAVGTTLADILSVSGSDLVADDLAADKLYGWDDSESKAIGFIIGSGLSVSGDTLSATASGGTKTYAVFTAEHNQPTATSFATLDTRNSIAVLDFDDASTESAVFVGIMPEAASLGSGLIVNLDFMATTATSGNVRWSVAFERCNTDLDSDSFDTATAATVATSGTSGIVAVGSITCTAIDGITAGDLFRLRVQRLGGDAADSASGDIELVAVELRSAA